MREIIVYKLSNGETYPTLELAQRALDVIISNKVFSIANEMQKTTGTGAAIVTYIMENLTKFEELIAQIGRAHV